GSEAFIAKAHETMDKIAHFSKPVIAAISGLALGGGCETALACDIRIAAEGTIFGVPESNLALFPAGGGTQRLPRVVGIGWATQMILTGDPIDCETALKIGLVTKIVPGDKLMEEAKRIAARLAGKAPITARVTKQCLINAISTDLTAGLLFEQKAFSYIFATEDQREGLAAFLEKRKPSFKGK
ncbi:MAG: enoyl-CoA hydratase/isomerase family protein, partial [Syntrophomonadaceae bacterium]|nr:enoyl-CoA hydratase/isomerase family protein [Syntrophomonadaceae bacterium]